jgi:hypothetical protein
MTSLRKLLKIETGRFPWLLLYLGVACIAATVCVYWWITGAGKHAVGPEVSLGGFLMCAWWAFLTFKSGVSPSRYGQAQRRTHEPFAFWSWMAMFIGLAALSLVFTLAELW